MDTGTPRVEIGDITDGDVPAVVDLWRACELTRPWNDPWRDLEDARLGATSTVLVARRAPDAGTGRDGVVATAMVGVDGHRGWVYYLAVDPTLQGTGLGREMVVAAEAWLVAQGARAVRLMVRSTNTAVRGFYERLGYTDQECVVLGRRLGED
ncbi:GNAT family acetyltransferase [Cellulosimicrobium terreum]|nr:GNAT family acetyltransferase [Cellulosimicrobium terreum]